MAPSRLKNRVTWELKFLNHHIGPKQITKCLNYCLCSLLSSFDDGGTTWFFLSCGGNLELRRGIQASSSTGPGKSSFHSNCEFPVERRTWPSLETCGRCVQLPGTLTSSQSRLLMPTSAHRHISANMWINRSQQFKNKKSPYTSCSFSYNSLTSVLKFPI